MSRVLIAILSASFLLAGVSPVGAQVVVDPCAGVSSPDGIPCVPVPLTQQLAEGFANPDACQLYAAQVALPALTQSFTTNPGGGPAPWAPLSQPFGAGPLGPATFNSPAGLVPAYGPLGPGQTAAAIAQTANPAPTLSANGTPTQNFQNAITLLGLGGLQQAEQGTLLARQGVASATETAAAAWVIAWATQASVTLSIMRGYCHGQQEAASRAAAGANR
jgi:hypothetical protein